MDLETRLRAAGLPDVPVNTEDALASTTKRGRARRQRRSVVLGTCAALIAVGVVGAGIRLLDDGATTDIATGASTTEVPFSQPQPGDAAVWDVDPTALPSADSSAFTAMVTRLGCNNGVTGTVLRPVVALTDSEVTVTFTVDAAGPGDRTCQGNDAVPSDVDIGEPIGRRVLVDGACAAGEEAATTSFCADSSGVRWRSDGGAIHAGDFAVSGQMVSVGGPSGAGPDPAPGTVRAVNAAGETVATIDTDASGTFELAVPNGTYRLIGRSPLHQGGEADCVAPAEVVVNDRYVDGVSVECQRL